MNIDKFQIKNFKCFDDDGCFIEELKPINIIIGKNNSGKSSLIELFKFLTTAEKGFLDNRRNGKTPAVLFTHTMRNDLIQKTFPESTSGGEIGDNHYRYGLKFEGAQLTYSMGEKNKRELIGVDREFKAAARNYFQGYVNLIPNPLQHKVFRHLAAERDILPEGVSNEISLGRTGIGATNLVQQIITRSFYESELVEQILLKELNAIINPDIHFSRILVQHLESDLWEIFLENSEDGSIPLSQMGSGVKTVLLVLLMLVVNPAREKRNIEDHVFAMEELENNLHPSMQRRLYYYLYEFAKKHKCIFFLTTHSSIVIDLYNQLNDTQIFHIAKVDGKTSIKSIMKPLHFKQILDDLEVKASDILQSNGIIWVEGPSDRVYLNKWISLFDNSLIEGNHYSIMFYGGRMLSNLSFDYNVLNEELIPLLKLNRNSFVIMDRDGKSISVRLNDTKKRIQGELGENNVWISKGREIENYLSENTINSWLESSGAKDPNFKNDINCKLEENISKVKSDVKIKYQLAKNSFSNEIINYVSLPDCQVLDLKTNINRLVEEIRRWNNSSV